MGNMRGEDFENLLRWIARREPDYADGLREYIAEAMSTTRDAALEEAKARILKRCCAKMAEHGFCEHQPCDYYQNALTEIRALKSSPAERFLPELKVREVLRALWDESDTSGERYALTQVMGRLGVDLDAKGETIQPVPYATVPPVDGPMPAPIRTITRAEAEEMFAAPVCACGHDSGWHHYGKKRGCMKKMPGHGNTMCPCKEWKP